MYSKQVTKLCLCLIGLHHVVPDPTFDMFIFLSHRFLSSTLLFDLSIALSFSTRFDSSRSLFRVIVNDDDDDDDVAFAALHHHTASAVVLLCCCSHGHRGFLNQLKEA
ncbi:hypothetical protein BKA81DRAFT_381273 [Phyllosticta paracitricarpa]|uniref:Uncharacterized protein n=2 Tax=Phyllosticta TaxID=121621 RepID=A0ABR1MIF9_9PEZI